jgi:hypothetical protein
MGSETTYIIDGRPSSATRDSILILFEATKNGNIRWTIEDGFYTSKKNNIIGYIGEKEWWQEQ